MLFERRINISRLISIGALSSFSSLGASNHILYVAYTHSNTLFRSPHNFSRLLFLAKLAPAHLARNARDLFQRCSRQKRRVGGTYGALSLDTPPTKPNRCRPSTRISPTPYPSFLSQHCP
jgi:hypothetical protein